MLLNFSLLIQIVNYRKSFGTAMGQTGENLTTWVSGNEPSIAGQLKVTYCQISILSAVRMEDSAQNSKNEERNYKCWQNADMCSFVGLFPTACNSDFHTNQFGAWPVGDIKVLTNRYTNGYKAPLAYNNHSAACSLTSCAKTNVLLDLSTVIYGNIKAFVKHSSLTYRVPRGFEMLWLFWTETTSVLQTPLPGFIVSLRLRF